jgi:hypothetical protein
MSKLLIALALLVSTAASAEYANYGSVELKGLARNTWNYEQPGVFYAMVCNVNGRDGFLSVRQCDSTRCKIERNLKRLAIVTVDTRYRNGNWVYVTDAFREHSEDGDRLLNSKPLTVSGWAHDGYLCNFMTY